MAAAVTVGIYLSPRDREVLRYLHREISATGVCPTYKDIAQAMGLSRASIGTVHGVIGKLERHGYIRRVPNVARSIEILKPPPTPEATRIAELERRVAELEAHLAEAQRR